MKVLLATAACQSDAMAREFVARARWPLGSEIDVLGVVEVNGLEVGGARLDSNTREFEAELRSIANGLPLPSSNVTSTCVVGSPAEAITQRARAMSADLIVVGTRGRGRAAAALLGSVSAGVIDRAPCPVLVARSATADRIALADDGSVGAAAAAALVQEWSVFAQSAVNVVSVVDMGSLPAVASNGKNVPAALYAAVLGEERACAHATLAERAHILAGREQLVQTTVRDGTASQEILAAARAFEADLIVMGSRGITGLVRVFTGSVAREVVQHASCSVLIARGWAAARPAGRQSLVSLGAIARG